jgi:hypothetical protein
MRFSKSKYCKGVQCSKILWLDRNKSDKFDDSVVDEARLTAGSKVGDLAKGYFGGFSEVAFSNDKSEMIAETQRLLNAGVNIIAEATFEYNGSFCSVDILRTVQGGYEIIEVKSSTASPTETAKDVIRSMSRGFERFLNFRRFA